ncbi:MAG TPA: TonB-dependent receptor [Steroidobacteraceae bacterium]|nr:TonB-dependent receptor [Steroidobacteraceae bacterium]
MSHRDGTSFLLRAAIGAAACWCTTAADAQTSASVQDSGALQEIVVTATKRESTVGDVPAAITAVTADALQEGLIADVDDLAVLVPNLDFGEAFGQVKLTMRGIGFSNLAMGTEGSVALNVDNVYIARPAGQAGLLFDLAQVEALRGPQGTLYGRNATGGTVNFTTARPTPQWHGSASLLAGNYDRWRGEFAVGGPIGGETLMFRVAGFAEDRGGYGTNDFNGRDIDDNEAHAARASFLWKPSEDFDNLFIVDYNKQKDDSGLAHLIAQAGLTNEPGSPGIGLTGLALGGTAIFDSYDVDNNSQPSYDRKGWGLTNIARLNVGNFQIQSTTGYRELDWWLTSDIDGTSAPVAFIQNGEDQNQFSQELNFNTSTDRLDLTFGLYYFRESIDASQFIPFYVGGPIGQLGKGFAAAGDQTTNAYAGYGQATFKATDTLNITAGLRYSYEKKNETDFYTDFVNELQFLAPYDPANPPFAAPFRQSVHWSSTTPKLGIEYRPGGDLLLYASASKGFKAGAFNFGGTFTLPGAPEQRFNPAVDPEMVWAYEVGFKNAFADRRVTTNAAAFYYDYKDLQVSQITQFTTQFTNAATAEVYGIEAELQANVTDNLHLAANASWLHARFSEFDTGDASRPALGVIDVSGNPLPQSPDFSAHVSADYTFDLPEGKLRLAGEYDWTDRIYHNEFKRSLVSQKAYGKANAFLTYRTQNEAWDFSAFVKNLTDKRTYNFTYVSTVVFGFPQFGWIEPPRTYGFQARYSF